MPQGRFGRLRDILSTSTLQQGHPSIQGLPLGGMRSLKKVSALGSQLLEPSSLPLPSALCSTCRSTGQA